LREYTPDGPAPTRHWQLEAVYTTTSQSTVPAVLTSCTNGVTANPDPEMDSRVPWDRVDGDAEVSEAPRAALYT
jgi:hypothetical protein